MVKPTLSLKSHRIHLPRGIFYWDDLPARAPFPVAYPMIPSTHIRNKGSPTKNNAKSSDRTVHRPRIPTQLLMNLSVGSLLPISHSARSASSL